MQEQPQKKQSPIWHSDIPGMLMYHVPILIALPVMMFLPFVSYLRHHDSLPAYIVAILTGAVGVVLLFYARLPLYRNRQFFTFGIRQLDAAHRRVYKLAYFFVVVSVLMLLALLLAVGSGQ